MWTSVGATALHYWQGYMPDHDHSTVNAERTVKAFIRSLFHFPYINRV